MKRIAMLLTAVLILTGCEYEPPPPDLPECYEEMEETRAAMGEPEEVNTYSERGYRNEDWWYWTRGYERSFTWGTYIRGCETSTYTFPPIY